MQVRLGCERRTLSRGDPHRSHSKRLLWPLCRSLQTVISILLHIWLYLLLYEYTNSVILCFCLQRFYCHLDLNKVIIDLIFFLRRTFYWSSSDCYTYSVIPCTHVYLLLTITTYSFVYSYNWQNVYYTRLYPYVNILVLYSCTAFDGFFAQDGKITREEFIQALKFLPIDIFL